MASGVAVQIKNCLEKIMHIIVRTRVNPVPAIREVDVCTLNPSKSFAPYSWAVSRETPMQIPKIKNIATDIMGLATPIAANASSPIILPAITASAVLYSC